MRKLSSSDRSALIKLAASLHAGSSERRTILAGLQHKKASYVTPHRVPGYFEPRQDYPQLYAFLRGDWDKALIALADMYYEGGDDPFSVARSFGIPRNLDGDWEDLSKSVDQIISG